MDERATAKQDQTEGAGGPSAPRAEERLSFLIHRVSARIANTANRLFKTYAIDSFSARILVLLLEKGEMRVGELVEAMSLPQPTLSHQLQRLERRALIRRRRLKEDNRSVVVMLTAAGRKVAGECDALSAGVYRFMIEPFSAAQIDEMKAMLAAMAERLARYDIEPEPPRRGRRDDRA